VSASIAKVQAALDPLRAAASAVDDEMFAAQLNLSVTVLANALFSARDGLNPARVGDIEFALNDVAGVVDQLSAADAARLIPMLNVLRADVARLKEAASLPQDVIARVRALQAKLRERRAAIERKAYAAGADSPIPHPPAELQPEAAALRERLAAAGFSLPALDALIAASDEFRLHSVNDLMNELDVVLG
jgi:hypothetical protein